MVAACVLAGGCVGRGHLSASDVAGTYRATSSTDADIFFIALEPNGSWQQWVVSKGQKTALTHGTFRLDGGLLKIAFPGGDTASATYGGGLLTIRDPGGTTTWRKQASASPQ